MVSRPQNLPKNAAQVRRAAELRVEGMSWESVAAELHYNRSTVEDYPQDHPEWWAWCFDQAWRKVWASGCSEAARTLRQRMRSTNEAVSVAASKAFLDTALKLYPPQLDEADEADEALTEEYARELAGCATEAIEHLAEVRPLLTAPAGADVDEPGGVPLGGEPLAYPAAPTTNGSGLGTRRRHA